MWLSPWKESSNYDVQSPAWSDTTETAASHYFRTVFWWYWLFWGLRSRMDPLFIPLTKQLLCCAFQYSLNENTFFPGTLKPECTEYEYVGHSCSVRCVGAVLCKPDLITRDASHSLHCWVRSHLQVDLFVWPADTKNTHVFLVFPERVFNCI